MDGATITGIAIIIGAGLFIMVRSHRGAVPAGLAATK
jgi:hypothetical protein